MSAGQIDLRIPPHEKPKPPGFPEFDPLSFISPLFDTYAGPARAKSREDSRLNPIIASLETLPPEILMIIPKIDILLNEQENFFNRLTHEIEEEERVQGRAGLRRVEKLEFDKGFHGWIERGSRINFVTNLVNTADLARRSTNGDRRRSRQKPRLYCRVYVPSRNTQKTRIQRDLMSILGLASSEYLAPRYSVHCWAT